jgi:hypothetical protein
MYLGRPGSLPAAAAAGTTILPEDVTFLDVESTDFVVLGENGTRTLVPKDGTETRRADVRLDWVDRTHAAFADLALADGALLLPTPDGWRYLPAIDGAAPIEIAVPPRLDVRPPGAFLEDVGTVTRAHPPVWRGPPLGGGEAPVLWALGGQRLVATTPLGIAAYDVSFLPPQGERHLTDLDADGTPEVVHVEWNNQDAAVAVFHAPPLAHSGGALVVDPKADLRPPAAVLRLPGYLVQHDFDDLDGDGRLDLVVTTIPVDARNTIRALTGRVTAHTKAFLCRTPGERTYPTMPDATVTSDIGIRIRFSAAGTIEIHRFFTIVAGGDFDGDGRRDLAIRTTPSEITIYRGAAEGVWEKTGRVLEIPPPGASDEIDAWAADLDGDAKDELVLVYRGAHGAADRVYLLSVGP